MFGLAEILLPLFWQMLPRNLREGFSKAILSVQSRTGTQVPLSPVSVFARGEPLRRQFAAHLSSAPPAERASLPSYSLVSTCYNEAETIGAWLDSVASQTHLPAEVVIVDGGSSDETPSRIRSWQQKRSSDPNARELRLLVIEEGRKNIAEGRNRGVREAHQEIIAFSDAGCELDRFWAERLLEPFSVGDFDVSMGWYRTVMKTEFSEAVAHFIVPQLENIDASTFLPSGRSLALRKKAFSATRGYPEYLGLAGEDSLFDYFLKTQTNKIAFVPEALVFWKFPQSPHKLFATIHNYAKGDAEGGKLFWLYYFNLVREFGKLGFEGLVLWFLYAFNTILHLRLFSIATVVVACCMLARYLGVVLKYRPFDVGGLFSRKGMFSFLAAQFVIWAQVIGFMRGLQARPKVEKKQRELATAGHFFYIAALCPTRDEESAEKKLILDYLSQGFFVTLVYQSPPKEAAVLFDHAYYEFYLRSHFDIEAWRKKEAEFTYAKLVYRDGVEDSLSRTLQMHLEAMDYER